MKLLLLKIENMKQFHEALFDAYSSVLDGPSHILNKMKGFWRYASLPFKDCKKAMKKIKKSQLIFLLLIVTAILIPVTLMGYKLYVLNYSLTGLIPAVSYKVETNFELDGHGNEVSLRTYLPKSDSRQVIINERNESGIFSFAPHSDRLICDIYSPFS